MIRKNSLFLVFRAVVAGGFIAVLAGGCDRFELTSRSSQAAQDSQKSAMFALEQRVNELQTQLESLKAERTGKPVSNVSDNGRYQLVINPQNSRASFLVDTRYGVAWTIVQDWKQKKDYFAPIGFQGGFAVPALQNEGGDVVSPEKESESIRSLAEVHQYVRQVQARNASENSGEPAAEPENEPEARTGQPAPTTARASLGHSESSRRSSRRSSSHHGQSGR